VIYASVPEFDSQRALPSESNGQSNSQIRLVRLSAIPPVTLGLEGVCFLVSQFHIHTSVQVIVNGRAGRMAASKSRDDLTALIKAVYPEATVIFTTEARDVPKLARDAVKRGSTLIVAGGGDGTINAVASVLVGTETVLGVLPLGTLNHFAKDLGIPAALESAVENLATGRVMAVDAGDVNGHIFVNNSGLGLYPAIVRLREKRQKRGKSKWVATAFAAARALLRYRRLTLRVIANGKQLVRRTSIVFVGNNEYAIEGLNLGKRARLDAAVLCLYIPRETDRLKLIWLTLGALMGRLQQNKDYDKILSEDLWVRSRRRTVHVSIDGEVIRLAPPLHYRMRPKALRVLVPRSEH